MLTAYTATATWFYPLGASLARLMTTAVNQLAPNQRPLRLCPICIGVGQGISVILERV